jgi:hypothetical protein
MLIADRNRFASARYKYIFRWDVVIAALVPVVNQADAKIMVGVVPEGATALMYMTG